jgi:hypothetical protein
MRRFFEKLRQGRFLAQDVKNPEAESYGGGVIIRPAQVAGALNSTRINRRGMAVSAMAGLPDAQMDNYEEIDYSYRIATPSAAQNRNEPYRFQYVQQGGYAGLLPWQIMKPIPESRPWEE